MNEILDLYKKNNESIIGYDVDWLKDLRHKLIEDIDNEGLPNKKNETWKYSDLNLINNLNYNHTILQKKELISSSDEIEVTDGNFFIPDSIAQDDGIILNNLERDIKNLKNYFYFDRNYFKKDFTIDLNTIFLSSGLTISLNEGMQKTIVINYNNLNGNVTNYLRNIVKVSKGAKLTLIENFKSDLFNKNSYNIFNNFWIDDEAELEHIIIQNPQKSNNFIYSALVYSYNNSLFNQLTFQNGSRSNKFQQLVNLLGVNSTTNLNGIYFGNENQFFENKTSVIHHKENCNSNQMYKGILTDEAISSYLSNTLVKSAAQKTNGYQLSRGMLLSDSCKLNSKPKLKIYADDVKCSHGSTVGEIDKNQLYYLQARGISKRDSRNILINAFCADIIEKATDKDIKKHFKTLINDWLSNNE